MRVNVLLFGVLKDIFALERDVLELDAGATLEQVLAYYQQRAPEQRTLFKVLAYAVNGEFAPLTALLKDGDEVALLPPVSGGVGFSFEVKLVREAIPVAALQQRTRHASDGAVCAFEGIVRDNTRGRRTLYLDYEAYEQMALRELERLAREAGERFAIREAVVWHRLGRMEIGETSVFIVVASAHRGAPFEACRWLIDTLKKKVPIWKKEYFEDGAVWADGDAFPAEVRA